MSNGNLLIRRRFKSSASVGFRSDLDGACNQPTPLLKTFHNLPVNTATIRCLLALNIGEVSKDYFSGWCITITFNLLRPLKNVKNMGPRKLCLDISYWRYMVPVEKTIGLDSYQ